MKRIKLSALIISVALLVAIAGSAALSQITFDRAVSGNVVADMDANAAVVFAAETGYSSVVTTDANGIVSINLAQAVNNNGSYGYNSQALFNIGTASAPVFKVTNNSDAAITVNLNTSTAGLTMTPATTGNTIAAGTSKSFYFTLNTNGIVPGTAAASITGTVQVR